MGLQPATPRPGFVTFDAVDAATTVPAGTVVRAGQGASSAPAARSSRCPIEAHVFWKRPRTDVDSETLDAPQAPTRAVPRGYRRGTG